MDLTATHSDALSPGDLTRPRPSLADALIWWHGGWTLAVSVCAGVLWFSAPWISGIGLAFLLGLAPAAAAFAFRGQDGPRAHTALVVVWAVAAALACLLTGGVSGPLLVWCLTPVAAAVVMGGAQRLALAAALSVLAGAVVAVAQFAGMTTTPPTGALSFGLGLTGLATTAVALAAAMLLAARRPAAVGAPSSDRAVEADHRLLDQLPCLVVVAGADGRLERLFGSVPLGVDIERLKDSVLADLAHPDDRSRLHDALVEAAATGRATLRFRSAENDQVWLGVDIRAVSNDRIAAVLRESTAEQARETALETARADAEALNLGKSRFLANMSHELRTPLNAIMGFSDMMRERIFGALPGKYVEYADLIHDAGSHLLDLINDVLDMSKIEAAKYELIFEQMDAREPISAALRLMRLQADDAGVQLRGILPTGPLEIDADRRALKQITLNLISNALKFTPKGGLVTVTLQALGGAMELSVADTGVGIASGDLERLGRPYEQAGDAGQQAKGTGLGLSLVRAFAELHGGEMVIESRLGEGTAVFVRLPVLAAEAPAATPKPDAPQGGRPSGGGQVIAFNPQR